MVCHKTQQTKWSPTLLTYIYSMPLNKHTICLYSVGFESWKQEHSEANFISISIMKFSHILCFWMLNIREIFFYRIKLWDEELIFLIFQKSCQKSMKKLMIWKFFNFWKNIETHYNYLWGCHGNIIMKTDFYKTFHLIW